MAIACEIKIEAMLLLCLKTCFDGIVDCCNSWLVEIVQKESHIKCTYVCASTNDSSVPYMGIRDTFGVGMILDWSLGSLLI
jgi:hypothetical protein